MGPVPPVTSHSPADDRAPLASVAGDGQVADTDPSGSGHDRPVTPDRRIPEPDAVARSRNAAPPSIELCDGIATELAAGRPPDTALSYAAEALPSLPGLTAVVDAAQNGDDVPTALIRAAEPEGCEGLRLLAGCWRVGVDRGGMLAAVIEGLAEALRDEQSHRDDIALQLAGPRATARLLAGLPILGLGMAAALGAKPLSFLFATLPGALCLTLGIGLDALGLWWTARLATAAERSQ